MAARELRYSYFEQLRQDIGAEDILVAHHRDDNVETLLLNLVRGTGVSGLAAIRPRNGHVVRPLLAICRKDIENYLTLHHQSYVTDSTNAIDDVLRNKIRLNVIPLLEEVNPAAVSNISKTIENVAEALKVIDDSIARSISKCTERQGDILNIDVEKLRLQPSAEQVLFAILSPCSFSSAQIRQIAALNAEVGRLWHSATHTLAVDRNRLLLAPRIVHDSTLLLNIPETGNYTLIDNNVRARITVEIAEKDTGFQASKDPNIVTLDAEKVSFPLLLRHVVDGDAFVPYGMKGRKLVSDYLTDRKRNYFQKQSQLVVEDASGRIAWLVGERTSAHAAVDADTIKILVLRYSTDE
jgi:tRNA(Ile)-lysidine synthase